MGEANFPRFRSCGSYTVARVTRSLSRWLTFFLLDCAVIATVAYGRQLETSARYLGSASCSSSSCHGGAGERHNQFITWSQRDFHTKAFLILTTARSTQIAQSLGIQNAERSPRCTVCHSPLATVAQSRLVLREQREQAVACESCHGPAESWLRSHTRRDYTYAMRVGSGMRDLRNIYVRANACVACHQVLEDQIAASGHPPLFFELTTQLKFEPPHWRELGESPVRTWLAGQATALRELSWNSALHNEHSSDRPDAQHAALVWLLAKATALDASLPKIPEGASLDMMQQAADRLARQASARDLDRSYASNLLHVLASSGSDFSSPSFRPADALFYSAKRLVLALEALTGEGEMNSRYLSEIRQLSTDVATASGFDISSFVRDLDSLRVKLENERR
jgi:hypothetical protein